MGWGKKVLIAVLVFLLLVAIAGGVLFYSLTSSYTRAAFLHVTSPGVSVFDGESWNPAVDGMELSEDHRVKTEKGTGDIVLYESVIIALEPFSEVSIDDLTQEFPKVGLSAGEVWNKFTGLIGVTNFEVVTPTTVATVRGTEFGVSFNEGVAEVVVGEGTVDVTAGDATARVGRYEKVTNQGDNMLRVTQLTPEEIAALKEKQRHILEQMRNVRDEEIDKNKVLLAMGEANGYDRSRIDQILIDVDEGREDDVKLAGMIPIQVESIDKVLALNREIREQIAHIES
ncbi:hypothetical protein GF342_05740 [Candidatus Woesearchaeota archaeon]|nr:hypothetical protein [Candidatus Woesearchaeota archaeon]